MKTLQNALIAIIFTLSVLVAGCSTLNQPGTRANILTYARPTAQGATLTVLAFTSPSKRVAVANYCYSSAVILRSLSGSVVTVEQFQAAITAGLRGAPAEAGDIATALSGVYSIAYAWFSADPDREFYGKWLNLTASGVEDAAARYGTAVPAFVTGPVGLAK